MMNISLNPLNGLVNIGTDLPYNDKTTMLSQDTKKKAEKMVKC